MQPIRNLIWVVLTAVVWVSCSDNKVAEPEFNYLVDARSTGSLSAAELRSIYADNPQFANLASSPIQSWRVVYTTLDPSGNPIEASGLVVIPTRSTPSILSLHRGTTFIRAEAPSLFNPAQVNTNAGWQYLAPIISSFGYIVAMPDLIGYGASSSTEHPFFITGSDARVSIDFLKAVDELLQREGITPSGRLFFTGYSQGGSTVMAILRALYQGETLPFTPVAATAGGGAYDLNAIADYLLRQDTIAGSAHMAFLMTSYLRTYFPNRALNTVFNEPYASRITQENLLGGTLSFDDITARLNASVRELFTEDFIDAMLGNGETELKLRLQENSLIGRVMNIPLRLYHGDADEIIPIVPTRGAILDLTAAGNGTINFIEVPEGNHFTTALEFGASSLTWFAFQ